MTPVPRGHYTAELQTWAHPLRHHTPERREHSEILGRDLRENGIGALFPFPAVIDLAGKAKDPDVDRRSLPWRRSKRGHQSRLTREHPRFCKDPSACPSHLLVSAFASSIGRVESQPAHIVDQGSPIEAIKAGTPQAELPADLNRQGSNSLMVPSLDMAARFNEFAERL